MKLTKSHDHQTGNTYSLKYSQDHFDLLKLDLHQRELAHRDFVDSLVNFLTYKLSVCPDTSYAIANALIARMSDTNLLYNNFIKVLSMFHFAYSNAIALKDYEQLAVWFHLSGYYPYLDAEGNTDRSVGFMRSLLPCGSDLSGPMGLCMNLSEAAIRIMNNPLREGDSPQDKLIDLSLFPLSFDIDRYMNGYDSLLMREMRPHFGRMKLSKNREQFFGALHKRKFVFRTETFRKMRNAEKNAVDIVDAIYNKESFATPVKKLEKVAKTKKRPADPSFETTAPAATASKQPSATAGTEFFDRLNEGMPAY